jgi:hypothetical protein
VTGLEDDECLPEGVSDCGVDNYFYFQKPEIYFCFAKIGLLTFQVLVETPKKRRLNKVGIS